MNLRMCVIIFSKNRPLQLDGILHSLALHNRLITNIIVFYKYDNLFFCNGYGLVRNYHPEVTFIEESSLQNQLVRTLRLIDIPSVMFCTDDGIFFSPIPSLTEPDWLRVAGVSLRLGQNSRYCHPANEHYRPPNFDRAGNLFSWRWKKAKGDFRIVYSLDAHIYHRQRILELLQRFEFTNPNQLEDKLNRFGPDDAPEWMLCPEQSCYVSLPINRVNTEFPNRAGLKYPVSEQELLKRFLAGQRMDTDNIVTSVPIGPHQEYPLKFLS